MSHANARLTLHGRRLLVERVLAGWPQAHVAEQLGVSRGTVSKWMARWHAEGEAGLAERSSRPKRSPHRLSPKVEAQVLAQRTKLRRGAVEIAAQLGLNPSTVGRVLARHGVPPLAAVDRVTGEVIRKGPVTTVRYEHRVPGSLIHVDVKKLGRIPDGGGWRLHGRSEEVKARGIGYDYVHTAIDDHSRVVYVEVHADERDLTCAGFLHRALVFFRSHGVRVRRVLTDNAFVYRRGSTWTSVCSAWELKRRFTKPRCPWTNGKAERFNRTLLEEWAYSRPWPSNHARTKALASYQHRYNTQRRHTALNGQPPISRLAA